MTESITIPESKRLIALEKTIKTGKRTFCAVGQALAEIRDSKLYRADYGTFEQYCSQKWGWKKAHAYRLIEAAETVKKSPIGDKIQTESQAREVAKVPEEKRAQVIDIASSKAESEDRPLTARDIAEAAEEDKPRVVAGPAPVEDEPEPLILTQLKRCWQSANKDVRRRFKEWLES
jgi:hypothetical protein